MNHPTTSHAAQKRLDELTSEVARKHLAGTITKQFMDQVEAEAADLETQIRTHRKGVSMSAYASPVEFGRADCNPGEADSALSLKSMLPGAERRIMPTSMFQLDSVQIKSLAQAAQQGSSLRVKIGSKGIEHGNFAGGLRDKAALTEGGLTPNLLPPIQLMGDRGYFGIPLEITRVANFVPNIAFEAAGVSYFSHTSNGTPAGYVAEGAEKPDTTPVVTENYVRPAKIAGRVNLTHELVQDAGDEFASALVNDLARELYNAESNLILNGTKAANGFDGINQTSGTLTRAVGTEAPLDTLNMAFVDLRQDFFEPDLVIVNPSTMGALRRQKDTTNRYILDLLSGPRGINQTSEMENLWNVPVVQTTQQAPGTAAVLSVKSAAAVVYLRESLTTFFDPYSQAASNIYQFISECRLALATPRPGAINLVSGLPTS